MSPRAAPWAPWAETAIGHGDASRHARRCVAYGLTGDGAGGTGADRGRKGRGESRALPVRFDARRVNMMDERRAAKTRQDGDDDDDDYDSEGVF